MKKIALILCMSFALFDLFAQSKDGTLVRDSINKIDSADTVGYLLNAVVLDSSMIAVPEDDYVDVPEGFTSAKRNPIYYFGHNYSTIFTEVNCMIGNNDDAFGLSLAYVPQVWGGYVSFLNGRHNYWLSGGVEYRLSSPWSSTDWHIYGGVAAGDGVGGEAGIRLYANEIVNCGKFAWIGGSMGLRVMSNGGVYFVGGFSLGLSVFTILFL